MNIKGKLPIIKDLLYKIPVTVYNHNLEKWLKDKARVIKRKGIYKYEFAKFGEKTNTMPLFKRAKGKMFVFTKDGKHYQPLNIDFDENKMYLPDHNLDQWRDMEMRQKEMDYKPKEKSTVEVFKAIGLGIAILCVFIGIVHFLTSAPAMAPTTCNCNINGIDLNYCQQIINNRTINGVI